MTSTKNRFFSSMLILIFASLCLTGCAGKHGELMKSAQASYQANNYEDALRDAVMALKHKPDYEVAQNFAPTFFNASVEARQNRIKALESTPDKFKWDQIVAEYKGLIEINTLVRNSPPLTHKKTKQRITFATKDYTSQLGEAAEKAAEAHYQEGIRIATSSDDVETQKRAAKEFRTVEEFVSGYKDVRTRYEQARNAGVKRIAILTFEDKTGRGYSYGALSETITDNIISSVLNDPEATEFLAIVSRNQLEQVMAEQDLSFTERFNAETVASIGKVLGVHEIVVGQLTQIVYTPAQTKRKTWDRQTTIRKKTGTERYIDKNGKTQRRDKYSRVKVSARVTHYQVESSVSIVGSYKILDAQTAVLKKADNFTTKHEFKAEWARFTGDQAALNSTDRELVAREEQHIPVEQEMVLEASNQLASELAANLKAYVR